MKKHFLFVLLVGVLLNSGCNKDTNPLTSNGDKAPSAPILVLPANSAIDVPGNPTFTWNQVSDASSYTFQLAKDSNFTTFTYNNSDMQNLSIQVTNLDALTKYYWRVNAVNSRGSSNWSKSYFTTGTTSTTPPVPILISPVDTASNQLPSILLKWSKSINAVKYTLQIATNTSFETCFYNDSTLTDTSKQLSGLLPSTTYYWRVLASNSFGVSPSSKISSFKIGAVPAAPQLSTPSDVSSNQPIAILLNWAGISGLAYTVQLSNDSLFSSFLINVSGLTVFSKQVSNLLNNTTYYWRVCASNSFGHSPFSRTFSFTTGQPPLPPSLLLPVNGASDQIPTVTLTWTAVADANIYSLQVSTSASFSNLVFDGGVASTAKQFSGLSNNTTYYWRVSVKNNYGSSAYSQAFSFAVIPVGASCPNLPVIIYEDVTYHTVMIGTQCWLKENLNVGLKLEGNTNPDSANGIIEKYCYGDAEKNCSIYGGLYQWGEAMKYAINEGAQGICPAGWHIPTVADFQILKSSVKDSANSLKSIGQGTDWGSGTNTSGFSALLAGARRSDMVFSGQNAAASFGTSSANTDHLSMYIFILYASGTSPDFWTSGNFDANSIRCLKN